MSALQARLLSWSAGRLALAIAAGSTLAIALLDVLVRDKPVPQGDDLIYERMADRPLDTHTFVFAYRIAIPWLVHVLPFDHTVSFSALAWICSGLAGAALFLLLEELGISRCASIPLAFVLALSPPLLVASLRQGRSPDPLSVLVMAVGTLFIVRRQPKALALTMLVGACNRESALFLGPLAYAVWAERLFDRRALGQMVAASAPALVAFVALRLTIPTVGRDQVPGYGGSPIGARFDLIKDGFSDAGAMARRLVTIFGPLWLLAPLALKDFSFARRSLVLPALCASAMTFALDWGRIAFIAAPVTYAAAAWALDRRPQLLVPTFAACAALVFGYATYMQVSGVDNIVENVPAYPVR